MRRPPRRDDPPPLLLEFAPEALGAIRKTTAWLATFDGEVHNRFARAVREKVVTLCREAAREVPAQTHEMASLHFSRPVFSARFQTGKTTRKRSSAGVWYLFYDLVDTDADGFPDLLWVLAVRHAAAMSLWQDTQNDGE